MRSYSFVDVAVIDGVRERFARADALVVLESDLGRIVWANGSGAMLLGYADVEEAIGQQSNLGPISRRQIESLSGFPAIGPERSISIRLPSGPSSRLATLSASDLRLPNGERGILLAAPLTARGGGLLERLLARSEFLLKRLQPHVGLATRCASRLTCVSTTMPSPIW